MVREFEALMNEVYEAVIDGKMVEIKIEGQPTIDLIPAGRGEVQ